VDADAARARLRPVLTRTLHLRRSPEEPAETLADASEAWARREGEANIACAGAVREGDRPSVDLDQDELLAAPVALLDDTAPDLPDALAVAVQEVRDERQLG
jgi:hypothetical protein